MKLFKIPVAPIGANCYVLSDDENKKALIIDPGGDFLKIKAIIDKENLTTEAVLLTHGHFDHIGAAECFLKADVNCYVKEEDAPMLTSPELSLAKVFGFPFYGVSRHEVLTEGENRIGDFAVTVYHTPGHSEGSVCIKVGDYLFTGDTLFSGGYGRFDMPGGNYKKLLSSLKFLAGLDFDGRVLPGHGEETSLKREKAYGVLENLCL